MDSLKMLILAEVPLEDDFFCRSSKSKDLYATMSNALTEAIKADKASGENLLSYVTRGFVVPGSTDYVFTVISLFASAHDPDNAYKIAVNLPYANPHLLKAICLLTVTVISSGEWGVLREWLANMKS